MHPILFTVGARPISTYSVVLGLALAAALGWLAWQEKHRRDGSLDVALCALLVGVLGARGGHVLVNWGYYAEQPLRILDVRDGGWSLRAGLLAGLLAMVVILAAAPDRDGQRLPSRVRRTAGLLVVPLTIALAGGWLACLFDGCSYGRALPPPQRWYTPDWPDLYGVTAFRLPSQLLGLALALLLLVFARPLARRPGLFLIALGSGDFIVNWTRGDLPSRWGPLSAAHWADLALIAAGILLEASARRRGPVSEENTTMNPWQDAPPQQRNLVVAGLVALTLVALALLPLGAAAQEGTEPIQTHVVATGETVAGIAARYGITVDALLEANDLADPDLVRSGRQLVIPTPPAQAGSTHIVDRGETLSALAARYGVSVQDILDANVLANPNYIFIGQRLVIPLATPSAAVTSTVTGTAPLAANVAVTPTARATSTPSPAALAGATQAPTAGTATVTPTLTLRPSGAAACLSGCELLTIITPTRGITVSSPLTISGFSLGFGPTLAVRVLDASGAELGAGNAAVSGSAGQAGTFLGSVTFALPATSEAGRIQVYSISSRDGATEHLASVVVALAGTALDQSILDLKTALEDKEHGALADLMSDPWTLGFYRSESLSLSPQQAIEQLQRNYLDPGQVVVDLAIDARRLLGDQASFAPEVTQVVYSTGWGADQADDALLLFTTGDDGRARWSGMIYVFEALRDYPIPR